MKKYNQQKRNLFLIVAILFVLGIGIGYSALTEKLYIDGSVAIKEMKWDVGFSAIEDNGGSVLSESSISEDGKTLTVLCDFGSNTMQKTCITKATITNNSTFDVGIISNPSIKYNNDYIHTLTFKWNNHSTYENKTVLKDNFIAKGESEEVILTIKSKFLSKDNLPSQKTKIPVTITLNFGEWQQDTLPTKNDLAVLKSTTTNDTTAFRSSTYKEKIKTITIEDKINIPESATESWDIGVNTGKVMAYVVPNETDSTYYDLYIQSDGQLYANKDMSEWFNGLTNVDSIKGLDKIDTSDVTNMRGMFSNLGLNSTIFTLDVNNLDTSDVTNMSYMFYYTGTNSTKLQLDVSDFDTGKTDNMSSMFHNAGSNSTEILLDVENFDTSNVLNMKYMFANTGTKNKKFTLDVSNFDTSKVTDMGDMFSNTGTESSIFTLDVSEFDTSNVTIMRDMFSNAGYSNPNFKLDVSLFDTSKVTDMSGMFWRTGYSNPNFTLDIKDFNTSNVTTMANMFFETGYNSTVLELDVNNFNTSNVTDMNQMFYKSGFNNKSFTLDVSGFNTSNVTNMNSMFYSTGYNSEALSLNLTGFDTSKVTNMEKMLWYVGNNSTKLNTSITIRNPNTVYGHMFEGAVQKTGSQITVNYTSETSNLVDLMIATKSSRSNVVKGVQVD